MPPPGLKPFQLLEINVISAQDLEPVSRKMKTYATAWVNPRRKLSSRVDSGGDVNPTWNDKFVFRVDEEFLSQDTSAVQIEIYSVHWFKDSLVGSVRVLVGNLIPPILRSRQNHQIGMRFVALQVRRPSGRPQGILNIGVTVLDSSMRSMPLYTQPATSAVGYHDFMGDEDSYQHHHNNYQHHPNATAAQPLKPILRRSRSERSEFVTLDDGKSACGGGGGSVVGVPIGGKKSAALEKDNSIISISNEPFKGFHKKGKASSVISGAELRDKKSDRKSKGRRGGKASSVISDSIVSKGSSFARTTAAVKPAATTAAATTTAAAATKDIAGGGDKELGSKSKEKTPERSPNANNNNKSTTTADDHKPTPAPLREPPKMAIGKPLKLNGAGKYVVGAPHKASSIWSDSEVGPSPSEVAAAMAERRYPLEEDRSSVLDGWSLDESVEGLRSKLERWRTELPPLYDRGYASSSFRSTGQHKRRHTEGSTTGMFSCFGNIYGYECQCICGKPPEKKRGNGRYKSPSSSIGSQSFL